MKRRASKAELLFAAVVVVAALLFYFLGRGRSTRV